MQQQTGLLQYGDKEKNDIDVFSKIVDTVVGKFIQNDLTSVTQSQTIKLKNVYIQVASLDNVIDIIQKNVIQNTSYQRAVNTISTSIDASSSQTQILEGPLQALFYVSGIVVGGFVIFGLILWNLRKSKK